MLLAFLISMMTSFDPSILTVPVVHAEELTREWTIEEMKVYATQVAEDYGLHKKRFLKTIECESRWDRFAVGDDGLSHGLAQFYHPTRDWGIATSSAYEPDVAIPMMAEAFSRGEAYRWTCFRLIRDGLYP